MSIRYSECLGEAGINPSVGNTGDAYDNALAEAEQRHYQQLAVRAAEPVLL